MKSQTASRSAGIIAAHRAIESSKSSNERVCYDPFARSFLPPKFTVIGETDFPENVALDLFKEIVPGFHEFFIARTRFIDDYLKGCIDKGIEQLVILGAGYDSRAYRFEGLKNRVKVFEVDHPATQTVKKERLKDTFHELPRYVTYVPVDFQKETLNEILPKKGYRSELKTLFIWEGVSMYVNSNAVSETLSFISESSGEKSVVFDYTHPDVLDGSNRRKEAVEWLKITEKSDEPLLFGIGDDDVEQFLLDKGFSDIETITSDFFKENYFTGVNDGREATPILSIVHAQVN